MVTEITEKYVAVEPAPVGTELKYIIRFDKSGKQPFWDGISVWEAFASGNTSETHSAGGKRTVVPFVVTENTGNGGG